MAARCRATTSGTLFQTPCRVMPSAPSTATSNFHPCIARTAWDPISSDCRGTMSPPRMWTETGVEARNSTTGRLLVTTRNPGISASGSNRARA
jgi:hypothetical protein